jgi:hypothetical protein
MVRQLEVEDEREVVSEIGSGSGSGCGSGSVYVTLV